MRAFGLPTLTARGPRRSRRRSDPADNEGRSRRAVGRAGLDSTRRARSRTRRHRVPVRTSGFCLGRLSAIPGAWTRSPAVRQRQPGDEASPAPAVRGDPAGDYEEPWERPASGSLTRAPCRKRPRECLGNDLLDIVAAACREDDVPRDVAVVCVVDGFEGAHTDVDDFRPKGRSRDEGQQCVDPSDGHGLHTHTNERGSFSVPTGTLCQMPSSSIDPWRSAASR